MRQIILNIACSLDGYIAREDRSIDWLPTDGEDFGMKKIHGFHRRGTSRQNNLRTNFSELIMIVIEMIPKRYLKSAKKL